MIKREMCVDIILTPEELANEFLDMSSDLQARFFNELSKLVLSGHSPFCFQLQSISNDPILTNDARWVMRQIGEYGEL